MCEVVCSSGHFGAVSPALARIRVAKIDETGIDLAVACFSCAEKPCLECPTEALAVGSLGQIVLDPDYCDACGVCVDACPIGAVGFYEDQPLFCDLCDGAPSCVTVCPSGALSLTNEGGMSLASFIEFQGTPSQKRVNFASAIGAPLRRLWAEGRRVDS
ncbi:MAG: 4Fe-4S dicluster domain-containing protein [Gemmatimonadota bacterium]|jgi:Fe-S-cluster-containing hydrogenase component 2